MSLSLCCPNCGKEIGISNNYQNEFFYQNDKGEPVCPNCGTGKDYGVYMLIGFVLLCAIAIIIALIIALIDYG